MLKQPTLKSVEKRKVKIMTRDEVNEYLKTKLGIEEPTKEQIDSFLNTLNGAVTKEKDNAKYYKAEANKSVEKLAELQAQLDAINNDNMTEIEKANKATNDALDKVSTLEKQLQTMTLKNSFAEKGITGENADKMIEGIMSGNFDVDTLANIITSATETAVQNKVNELANNAGSPTSGSQGQNKELSVAEQYVMKMHENDASNNAGSDILANYL